MKHNKASFLALISLIVFFLPLHAASTEDLTDYLCFTAEEDGSTVALTKKGTPPNTVSLRYSTDKDTWKTYTIGSTITLSKIGDKVYFRATSTNPYFGDEEQLNKNYYYFKMSGKIAGSGNVMSLLDQTCKETTVPKYAFCHLFDHCTSLVNAPKLPATTLAKWCYAFMFCGCSNLTTAPVLPATTLAERCYVSMFWECSSLINAPKLPTMTLAQSCYSNMFYNCSSLKNAPELPATTLTEGCYNGMFVGCKSLVTAPTLPATSLANQCYGNMFSGCSSLKNAPELPATTLDFSCYLNMFGNCTSLVTTPALPATTLTDYCYSQMFHGCTSLATAPKLPATTLTESCYASMFSGCTSLNAIEVGFSSWPTAPDALTDWVKDVAAKGTFTAPCELPDQRGTSFIPEGWEKAGCEQEEDPTDYLCFTAEEDGSMIALSSIGSPYDVSLEYSMDKISWESYLGGYINLSKKDDKVYLRATDINTGFSKEGINFYFFNMTGKIAGSGNIMSLLDKTCQQTSVPAYAFQQLFKVCTSLVSAPKLPATTLAEKCYSEMFIACTSLTSAPDLPATTLGTGCYSSMFGGCTSIVTAPKLPATTLAGGCYSGMFNTCTSLITPPALPAKILATNCYSSMFSDCTSLISAPELPATTLADGCYFGMFKGCSNLVEAPILPAKSLTTNCYFWMFADCISLTSAPALPATTLAKNCYTQIFDGCTSLTSAPELPATTLAWECYSYMFRGCTSLSSAPKLPANTLTDNCYAYMFSGCTSLNAIEVGFSSWPTAPDALTDWVSGVASKGTFIAPCELPDQRGTSFIPTGWEKAGCEQEEDPTDYLCFTAEEANSTIALTERDISHPVSLQYSMDKKTWNTYTIGNTIALPKIGNQVYFRASKANETFNNDVGYYYFEMDGRIAGSGNIMSLLDNTCRQTTVPECAFSNLFLDCRSLTTAPKLPATTLARNCYNGMFSGCTSLISAPELPAKTLAGLCYHFMFSGCASLVTAPELPATTLAEWCYANMFWNCYSLKNAPELPATKLEESCYLGMFESCTSLAKAPELPATTLTKICYSEMFRYCTSLTTAPKLPAKTLTEHCYAHMFSDCRALNAIEVGFNSWPNEQSDALFEWVSGVAVKGTFTAPCELPSRRGISYIPEGWTKEGECEKEYTLAITSTEGGFATGGGRYKKGTSVTITATATDPCYTFVQWSDEVTENPRNIIVTQDSSLTAIFEEKTYPILPVVERYSWLLMLNMKAIREMGYDFKEDAVRWYRIQGTPDDVNQALLDDEFVCNGYSLTIDQNLAGTGSYYAVVDLLSTQEGSEEPCEGRTQSEVIMVENPIPDIPKVYLSPTLVEANNPMCVLGLVPEETTLIRIFNTTGQLLQEYRSQQQSEYTIKAFSHPGCYYMHIENSQQITTLPYIVK